MHSPKQQTRLSDDILAQIAEQVAAQVGADFADSALVISLCDVDLPAFVANGELYVQAPLPLVFDAFAAYISDGLSILETRVSETRSAALASVSFRRAVFGTTVASEGVVRNGEVEG